jgi:hypothetical protein
MTKKKSFFNINVLAVLLVVFLAVGVYGQEPDLKPVAEEMIGGSGITWMPKVNYAQLVLTISRPDGTVSSTTFDSGTTPFIGLAGIMGDSYADGSYTYELRVISQGMQKVRQESEVESASQEKRQNNKALTQTGYFSIQGGAIVTPGESEGGGVSSSSPGSPGSTGPPSSSQDGLSGTADVCYADDLIVDGSLCVGFDCVCNYSFGFDTLVLTENNLRIFFSDTSVGSFPSGDWRIVINDSASGGASYFGVEDSSAGRRVFTLEAGAPSHSLYVDDGGRVGLGTSTPVVDLHMKSGNTPAMRLEQDGSSGFSPQTFDVAGNETNFFVRDATNGSTLPFRIQPGAPSNVLTLRADGRVGIGTWAPAHPVHLLTNSSTNALVVAERTSGATVKMGATSNQAQFGSISDHPLKLVTNNVTRMSVNTDNSLTMTSGASCTVAGVWTNASSRELKENIRGLSTDEALETLAGLNPVRYNYKVDKDEEYLGFIAEDVPDMVAMKDRKHMTPMDVVAVLTKVVQEQQKSLNEQQEIAREQQKTISELKEKMAHLEKNSN